MEPGPVLAPNPDLCLALPHSLVTLTSSGQGHCSLHNPETPMSEQVSALTTELPQTTENTSRALPSAICPKSSCAPRCMQQCNIAWALLSSLAFTSTYRNQWAEPGSAPPASISSYQQICSQYRKPVLAGSQLLLLLPAACSCSQGDLDW